MGVTWMKMGAESTALAKADALAQEMRKNQQGKLFRYWMAVGEEGRATFVDGVLTNEGYLEPPRYYEHQLFLNGSWQNWFVCPQMTAPHLGETCPVCLSKDTPSLVSVFTVIDHREFISKKDPTKKYKDTLKLFVAKSSTMEMLQKIASKKGGLAGCTFDISRIGDKSPPVGSMFDFVEKQELDVLQQKYTREEVDPKTNAKMIKSIFVPADYEKEIEFLSAEELMKLGLGAGLSAPKVSGYTPPGVSSNANVGTDYSSQL
jgi:hypothetical protein